MAASQILNQGLHPLPQRRTLTTSMDRTADSTPDRLVLWAADQIAKVERTLGTLDVHHASILRAHARLKRDVGGLEVVRDIKGSITIVDPERTMVVSRSEGIALE